MNERIFAVLESYVFYHGSGRNTVLGAFKTRAEAIGFMTAAYNREATVGIASAILQAESAVTEQHEDRIRCCDPDSGFYYYLEVQPVTLYAE